MADQKFERGMKMRRAVLGDDHVERAEANTTAFDADFQRFITEYAWGDAWQGEAIDRKSRHLITIGMLAALGREHELALHIKSIANTGVTQEELSELFQQVAIYAGVPAANSAIAIAKSILAETKE